MAARAPQIAHDPEPRLAALFVGEERFDQTARPLRLDIIDFQRSTNGALSVEPQSRRP
jgi:hypothetical protein